MATSSTIEAYTISESKTNNLIILTSTPRFFTVDEIKKFKKLVEHANAYKHFMFMSSVKEDSETLWYVPVSTLSTRYDYKI